MHPEELTASPTGLYLDFGDGPKTATVDDWDWALAQQVVLRPESVEAADDAARALVACARRDPATRRLALRVRAENYKTPRPSRSRARASRARRTRRTRTARATRAGPSDEPDPPLARLRGFLPASIRMVRHIERRLGARAAA
jgi:hypothetical protein